MKLLLTSAGISNPSIHATLVDLLGKPIGECNALCIPTAIYTFPGGHSMAYRFITGTGSPMCELGWRSLGVLELTALPSISKEQWTSAVREADALLVCGGDPLYLRHWMQQSGLADLFASLKPEMVYVGISAGSMVVTDHIGEVYPTVKPRPADDIKLEQVLLATPTGEAWNVTFAVAPGIGLVDFSLFPHLDNKDMPDTSLANVEKWAARVPGPMYGIDDQTAIKVVDGTVEVISEGQWKLLSA